MPRHRGDHHDYRRAEERAEQKAAEREASLDISEFDPDDAGDPEPAPMPWRGFLHELSHLKGSDAHAVHQRLAECTPFMDGAIEAAGDSETGHALRHLKNLLHGTEEP